MKEEDDGHTQRFGDRSEVQQRAADVSSSIKWAHRKLWVELSVYAVFLTLFLISALVPFVTIAWDGYQLINTFTKYTNTLEWPEPSNSYREIHSVADFWSWWRGPFRCVMLGLDPYAEDETEEGDLPVRPDHRPGYVLSSFVLGTVRLRQQRVARRGDCDDPGALLPGVGRNSTLCYDSTLWDHEAREDFAWPQFIAANTSELAPVGPPAPAAGLMEDDGGEGGGASSSDGAGAPSDGADSPLSGFRRRVQQERQIAPQRPPRVARRGLAMAELRFLLQTEAAGPADAPEPVPQAPPLPAIDGNCTKLSNATAWADSYRENQRIGRSSCDEVEAHKRDLSAVTPAFTYRSHKNLTQAYFLSATRLQRYDGGGYAHDFTILDKERFDNDTDRLVNETWIDAATRVVTVELSVYSPGTNLVVPVIFMVEVHGSGFALSRIGYEAFRKNPYRVSELGGARAVIEIVFVILCLSIFASDAHSAIVHRNDRGFERWWRNPFFWMSLAMAGATLSIVAFRIVNRQDLNGFDPLVVTPALDPFGSQFARLHGPAANIRIERSLIAILAFCVWLRIFKYTRRVPVFGTIGRTITRAFPAIVVFIFMSAVVFVGFAQAFYLGFYTSTEGFQSMRESLMSMVRFIAGDVDYDALVATNTVLAPVLYTLALIVIGFVWTSTLLAIVINAYYEEVADEDKFAFDTAFQDYATVSPLVRLHKEYDADGMDGVNTIPLTPDNYNRFVINSLARFDTGRGLMSMFMSNFLDASAAGAAGDEAATTAALSGPVGPADGRFDPDNRNIIVRFGHLRHSRKGLDAQALYFPKWMDEHRCRAWWQESKHHLRVGDAVFRYIRSQAPKQFNQFITHLPRNAISAAARAGAPLRTATSAAVSSRRWSDAANAIGRTSGHARQSSVFYATSSANDSGKRRQQGASFAAAASGKPATGSGRAGSGNQWAWLWGGSMHPPAAAAADGGGAAAGGTGSVSASVAGSGSLSVGDGIAPVAVAFGGSPEDSGAISPAGAASASARPALGAVRGGGGSGGSGRGGPSRIASAAAQLLHGSRGGPGAAASPPEADTVTRNGREEGAVREAPIDARVSMGTIPELPHEATQGLGYEPFEVSTGIPPARRRG